MANSFDVANKLPNLIYMVIIGGLVNAVLVPAIVRATKQSDDDGQAFINKLLTVAIVLLGLLNLGHHTGGAAGGQALRLNDGRAMV